MARMTGPDCAFMCSLINTKYTHTHTIFTPTLNVFDCTVFDTVFDKVNGGVVEVAEIFLKALPDDPKEACASDGVSGSGGRSELPQERSGGGGGGTKKGKRFAPIALITEERAAELRDALRAMLVEFLELCRQLVLKTRTVLNVPRNASMMIPRAIGEERTAEEVGRRGSYGW